MDQDMSYNTAYTGLQALVCQIEHEDMQLDALAGKVHEANELIKHCETKLRAIEGDISKAME